MVERIGVEVARDRMGWGSGTPSYTVRGGRFVVGPQALLYASPVTAADDLPERIGPYRVDAKLGAGGMGVVYRGWGPEGGPPVAVKVLRTACAGPDPHRQSRFVREAQIRLDHPNLVGLVDSGLTEAEGVPWIAFELLEGEGLDERLRRGVLPPREALEIARQAAEGLRHAHAAGVIHRDIKPSNLFLTADGTLKVLDFGVARLLGGDTRLTHTGQVLGTAAYLSPEQASGNDRIDGRSDLWALGVVLYEMLAGHNPFDRGSVLATVVAVMSVRPPPVSYFAPGLSSAVDSLVGRCLERGPDQRWPNAGAFASAAADLMARDELHATGGDLAMQARGPTSATAAQPTSIRPGEERLVAVVIGRGVETPGAFRRSIEALGGICLPHDGDRMIGVFGAQHWEGDEIQRAAKAAARVRVTCRAVAVASGRASHDDMTTMAGAVLDAADAGCALELEGVAVEVQSARTLAGHDLVDAGGGFYELPVATSVGTPWGSPAPRRSQLVGRDSELAQMRRVMQRALEEARATSVLVVGSPGMGKSRLRGEMLRLLEEETPDPPRVLAAGATPLMRHRSHGLVRELLGQGEDPGPVADETGATTLDVGIGVVAEPEVRRLVRDALGEGHQTSDYVAFFGELLGVRVPETDALQAARRDPQLMNDRIRGALIDWFVGLSAQGSLAVVIDDLHWADDESVRLLADVAQQLADAPLLVFASSRPQMVEAGRELSDAIETHRLELRGLLAADVTDLGRSLLGRDLSRELVERLIDHTGGNPLFVEQTLLALSDAEQLDQPAADLPIPLTVEAAIQSRLDHLPTHENEVCKHAAVIEEAFDERDIEELGPLGAREALDGLVRDEVLTRRRGPRGAVRWDFRSQLVRDVSRRSLDPALRRKLHARRAAALQSRPEADAQRVALHWERAGEVREAARAYVTAIRQASRRADAPAVLHCAERALTLGPQAQDLFQVHLGRSEALESLGHLQRQGEALQDAIAASADAADRARVLTDHAVWLLRSGRTEEALAEADRAVQAAGATDDDEIHAKALGRRGTILIYAGRVQDAAADLERAAGLIERSVPHLAPLSAGWQAQLATARGDHAARVEWFRRSAELYQQVGDLRRVAGAELNMADAYNRLGLYEEAAAALRDVVDKARRVGQRLWEGYAWLNRGYALARLERAGEAREALAHAAEIAEQTGELRLGFFARLYATRAGAGDEGRAGARDARQLAVQASSQGLPSVAVLANTAAAGLELEGGDPLRALELSTEAMRQLEQLGSLEEDEGEVYLTHARALAACGREDEAALMRQKGRVRILEIASRIDDEGWRERFLRQVPAHRELL